jgi:tetratricopeptide (TPR) repeat protein
MQLRDLFDEFPLIKDEAYPLVLQNLLREDLDVYKDAQRTERLLLEARALLPGRLEILIALYKMYAYAYRMEESLALVDEVLARAAAQGGFSADWRQLKPDSARWSPAQGMARVFLYSLKARGFVLMRKGELPQAVEVLAKLDELDPQDQVGGSVVLQMAKRLQEDEDAA